MSQHYTIASDAVPYHYVLRFEPDLKTFNFTGQTIVKMKVAKPTNSIKLNAKDLKIKSASIKNEYGEQKCTFVLTDNNEVTFNYVLNNKDRVIIKTDNKIHVPSKECLDCAKTTFARRKIQQSNINK